jgi:hypothetical protein
MALSIRTAAIAAAVAKVEQRQLFAKLFGVGGGAPDGVRTWCYLPNTAGIDPF